MSVKGLCRWKAPHKYRGGFFVPGSRDNISSESCSKSLVVILLLKLLLGERKVYEDFRI